MAGATQPEVRRGVKGHTSCPQLAVDDGVDSWLDERHDAVDRLTSDGIVTGRNDGTFGGSDTADRNSFVESDNGAPIPPEALTTPSARSAPEPPETR